MDVDAILLAGGRGSRLGGVDKQQLEVGGRTLLECAVDATDFCRTVVAVGPSRSTRSARDITWTREHPIHSGPVAGIAAGVRSLPNTDESFVVVLATDLPFVTQRDVQLLITALRGDPTVDAVFTTDAMGSVQYLYGVWRQHALRTALGDSTADRSVKSLLPQNFTTISSKTTVDVDTSDDLASVRRSGAPRVSIADARAIIATALPPLPSHAADTRDAIGAVLADDLRAAVSFPRFDTSAMDGYAVADEPPWTIRSDVALAGSGDTPPLTPRTAVRIATGARVPVGATSVVRDEYVTIQRANPDSVLDRRPDTPIQNDIRAVAEDWSAGAVLASAGAVVTPAIVSAAITAGNGSLSIRGPVTARTMITGTEVRSGVDAESLLDGQIQDSIGPVLPRFLLACGMRPNGELHTVDSETGFDDALGETTDVDVVVVVGATGGGAADRLRGALDRLGATVVVSGIASRPGGSVVVAVLPDHRVVIGLPGNPFACVAALLCLGPSVVAALTGAELRSATTGRLTAGRSTGNNVSQLVPVSYVGQSYWRPVESVRTAHLGSLIGCDGIAVVTPGDITNEWIEILPIPTQ